MLNGSGGGDAAMEGGVASSLPTAQVVLPPPLNANDAAICIPVKPEQRHRHHYLHPPMVRIHLLSSYGLWPIKRCINWIYLRRRESKVVKLILKLIPNTP